jgi:dipeptidyl aminopeptidase/acylaminoacyl peptidase
VTGFERRLREELRAARPPRAAEAERRAWHMVRAAHAGSAPVRRRHPVRRLAAAALAAVAIAAVALTPAGAKMGDWIDDVVSSPPEATRSSLSALPTEGRLLVMADGAPWIVNDDGARRRLGDFADAAWSPGGLHVVGARGRELVALDPSSTERWTRPAPGRVSAPRWSPDGFRIAYRSGADLYVVAGDNSDNRLLWRGTEAAPPAWKPLPAPAEQVVAFAAGGRVRIVEADTARRIGATPAGPAPREIWWAEGGRRLVTVTERSVRVHGPRGRLLRAVALPRGLSAVGSALAPGGLRLAIAARPAGDRSSSRLLLLRLDRQAPPRLLFSTPGAFAGLTWSIDGKVLVLGLPQADQWLFVHPRSSVGFESVRRIRGQFGGGAEPRTGAFPRPAGWCYAEPANRTASGQPPCSVGSAP